MKRKLAVLLALLACFLSVLVAKDKAYPSRPILMIVPFGPGGATDLITRKTQPIMEKMLGQPIAVQNMPGGATAIGQQYVQDAKHDGYTVLAQPTDITSIAIMGQSKLMYKDWAFVGIAAAVPSSFVVHPDSQFKTIEDLVAVMKTTKLTCAVADSGCAWTRAVGLFCKELNLVVPQFVPSGGGHNAAVSAMKKEVDFAACGLAEAIDLIEGDKLRTLAYWGDAEVTLPNGTKIPTFGAKYASLAKYTPFGGWVGMAVPANTPKDALDKLINAYKTAVSDKSFIDFCNERHFNIVGKYGSDADAYAKDSTSINAYLMYDLGFTKTNPAKLGIQRLK